MQKIFIFGFFILLGGIGLWIKGEDARKKQWSLYKINIQLTVKPQLLSTLNNSLSKKCPDISKRPKKGNVYIISNLIYLPGSNAATTSPHICELQVNDSIIRGYLGRKQKGGEIKWMAGGELCHKPVSGNINPHIIQFFIKDRPVRVICLFSIPKEKVQVSYVRLFDHTLKVTKNLTPPSK